MNQRTSYGPDRMVQSTMGWTGTGPRRVTDPSALTYEPFYGLQTKPFSVSTDPRGLYRSQAHTAVIEELLAAIRRREGLIVLTGEMGTGKTTLCRAALYQLDRKTLTTFVPDPSLSREDLLRMLLVGFGEVSVEELKQGRLRGANRADLGCQLFEFLTSLESVDAFAVLVIDEAQLLGPPLVEEIKALSELEAGRRLLQIVLVGQPSLKSRLTQPEMASIAQRVTTICELQPLDREGIDGYVAHRLTTAGGNRDRVEFSPAALELIHHASRGVPRLANRICDRALVHGHTDRAASIGRGHVVKALHDLELVASTPDVLLRAHAPATLPGGLFTKNQTSTVTAPLASELQALLDLPPVTRRFDAPRPSAAATYRVTPRPRRWLRRVVGSLRLPALGMIVMLGTASIAAFILAGRPARVALPPLPKDPSEPRPERLAAIAPPAVETTALTLVAPVEQPAQPAPQTWFVQVAAFASAQRATALVGRLTAAGMPAFEARDPGAAGALTFVRVGPFPSAEDADNTRDRLRATPAYQGAFVRNITRR